MGKWRWCHNYRGCWGGVGLGGNGGGVTATGGVENV